jgi:hypothetical protein
LKKLLYVEENFISPSECQELIDLSKANKEEIPYGNETRGGDTFLTTLDGIYFDEGKNSVVERVTNLCKNFDDRVVIDYAGVVRWPVGTFMKPHIDPHRPNQEPDLFAAVLYLNDDFTGGYTGFEEYEVKPETGKLLLFSNSIYKHHVTKIEGVERFALSIWYNRK